MQSLTNKFQQVIHNYSYTNVRIKCRNRVRHPSMSQIKTTKNVKRLLLYAVFIYTERLLDL